MSRHREMLRALVRLGKTPEDIAAEVPMDVRNLESNLNEDWPIRKRFVAPLEAYAQVTLRQAYALAVGEVARNEQLRADPESSRFIDGLRRDFATFFGAAIDGGTPPRGFNGQQAVRALVRLEIPLHLIELHADIPKAQLEHIQVYGMTRPEHQEPLERATRNLLRAAFEINERLSVRLESTLQFNRVRQYMADVIDTWRYLFNDDSEVFDNNKKGGTQ